MNGKYCTGCHLVLESYKFIQYSTVYKTCNDCREYYRNQKKEAYKENPEKMKQMCKNYYQKNKEVIKEQRKQYRKESKKVNCECGAVVVEYCIQQHYKSKKHLKFVETGGQYESKKCIHSKEKRRCVDCVIFANKIYHCV